MTLYISNKNQYTKLYNHLTPNSAIIFAKQSHIPPSQSALIIFPVNTPPAYQQSLVY